MITKNIYQRINAVMFDVDYIQKCQKKVNNQYTYVSHDDVTGTLHPVLCKHGIAVLPTVLEMTQDGNRTMAKVEVSFVNIDDPKDKLSVVYVGYGIDASDKGPGKAISYACKYALLKVFCLETGDDPDHDQQTKHEPEKPKTITVEQWSELNQMIDQCDGKFQQKVRDLMEAKNMKSLAEMSISDYAKLRKNCIANIALKESHALSPA